MPEGHTIHRLARDQGRDLRGRALRATTGQSRFEAGAALVDGTVLTRSEAWGKHLFHTFDTGRVLHVHLGLIGKWFRRSGAPLAEPSGTTRLRLSPKGGDLAGDVAWDLTGPMICAVVTRDDRTRIVAGLGPDPLRRDADPERLWSRLTSSTRPVGLMMMEQDVIAGIGNVYRSEILNIVGIDPRRPARDVSREEFERLWAESVHQLRAGVRRNRIVTMAPHELPRPLSKLARGEGLYAYKQERCGRCATELEVFPLAGRTTWRCPTCQPR